MGLRVIIGILLISAFFLLTGYEKVVTPQNYKKDYQIVYNKAYYFLSKVLRRKLPD